MSDERMGLVIPFPDQSEPFTYGFEMGILYHKLTEEPDVIDQGFLKGLPVRIENQELVDIMAEYFGYKAEYQTTGVEGWIGIRLTRIQLPKILADLIRRP
jgi:hypothetical protein